MFSGSLSINKTRHNTGGIILDHFQEEEYSENIDLKVWGRLARYVIKYRKEVICLTVSNIIYSLLITTMPRMTKYAVDVFVEQRDLTTFFPFVGLYFLLTIISGLLTYLTIEFSAKIEVNIVHDIREDGFKNLQRLSFSYYDTTPVGWILARMTSDAQRIGDCIAWGVLDLAWAFSVILFTIINMIYLSPKLAFICLAIMPVLLVISIFFQRKILSSQRIVRKINSQITGSFNEGITGARTTKTLVREEKNFHDFKGLSGSMKKASIHTAVLSGIFLPIVMIIGMVSTSSVVYFGGNDLLKGIITFGTLSAFINYTMQMFEPVQQIARIFAEMQSAEASAERTLSLLSTEPDVVDTDEVIEKYGDYIIAKKENWESVKGEIEFKNVSFSYKTGEQVLEDFSLKINKGEKIALVGTTGSGKSTIVNLICRFYEPTSGEILIDGRNYKERSQLWLHSNLGYVLQTPHLFSGTVKDNIRYGKLDATDEEIINAAKAVNAYDFIMSLKKGFDTEVGEGGNKLSSGEKQLISFARAIIKKPAIFVLDEATSSIDTETEVLIQKAIENVLRDRTSFIIAHRLSTIRTSDRILLIDNGKVVEQGSHKELLKLKGRYYKLYTNQMVEEQERLILGNQ